MVFDGRVFGYCRSHWIFYKLVLAVTRLLVRGYFYRTGYEYHELLVLGQDFSFTCASSAGKKGRQSPTFSSH